MPSSQTNPLQFICGELSNKSITIHLWRALKQIHYNSFVASSQTNPLQFICGELSNKSITIHLWRAFKQIHYNSFVASSQTNPLQLICGELSNKSITIHLWRALKQITKAAGIRGKNEAFASSGGAHLSQLCQPAYLEIRRIGSIRHYLSSEATKTLASSLVLYRLDYCNVLSLLALLRFSLIKFKE